jgi:hypothetical protein
VEPLQLSPHIISKKKGALPLEIIDISMGKAPFFF